MIHPVPEAPPTLATAPSGAAGYRVFIDFDNTITRGDVLDGLIERFARDGRWRVLEEDWAAGRIGARACLEGQLLSLQGTPEEFSRHLAAAEIDPGFLQLRDLARRENVDCTIVSDNFDFFIGAIARRCGFSDVPVFANHVEFSSDRLRPSFPYFNPDCPGCAHCKKTHFSPRRGDLRQVIYVGDGRSDICPAGEADVVFAKAGLLAHLRQAGVPCRAFGELAEVAATLHSLLHENHP